jgi:hypothetical protein
MMAVSISAWIMSCIKENHPARFSIQGMTPILNIYQTSQTDFN